MFSMPAAAAAHGMSLALVPKLLVRPEREGNPPATQIVLNWVVGAGRQNPLCQGEFDHQD